MTMYLRHLVALLLLLTAGPLHLQAQTTVLATPVADAKGMVAFQISEIIVQDGEWDPPLTIGELIYPQRMQKAHPIMRFGESIVIVFSQAGDRKKWQGLHVHNGCIPAMHGKPLQEMVQEIQAQAEQAAKDEAARIAAGGKPREDPARKSGEEQFAVCPICKQRHIRIR